MVKEIIQLGNPLLLKPSEDISKSEINSKETREIAKDLIDTIKAHKDSAAGLSGVQIGVMKKIFAIKIEDKEKNKDSYIVLINPEIEEQSSRTSILWEGCMSISSDNKRLFGPVVRSKKVKVSYYDINGKRKKITGVDFMSHLLLHEIDHLNGKLFLQYVNNPENLWNEEELDKYLEEHNEFPAVL